MTLKTLLISELSKGGMFGEEGIQSRTRAADGIVHGVHVRTGGDEGQDNDRAVPQGHGHAQHGADAQADSDGDAGGGGEVEEQQGEGC